MDDAFWPDEMRRLLKLVLARGRALPRGSFGAQLAEQAPARERRVVREGMASGTNAYELDVADALGPDGDVWFDAVPVAWEVGARGIRRRRRSRRGDGGATQ